MRCLDVNAAIGTHGERRADCLLILARADRNGDNLVGTTCFLQPEGLLDRDLVERVHRHLDVGEFDARIVGLDADLDVVVDYPLDRD